jgi:hypothetical protein
MYVYMHESVYEFMKSVFLYAFTHNIIKSNMNNIYNIKNTKKDEHKK